MDRNQEKEVELVLASSSPRRQELIRVLNLPVTVQASDADETVPDDWEPARVVEELSVRKAQAVLASLEPQKGRRRIVVGSDTIVVQDGEVLGKPRDAEDAKRMLRLLQGREHLVYSGLACLEAPEEGEDAAVYSSRLDYAGAESGLARLLLRGNGPSVWGAVGFIRSKVGFWPMSEEEIEAYVQSGAPLDKAGAYGIQGAGSVYIRQIEGDFYSIMGLPLSLLYRTLVRLGVQPLQNK